MSVAGQVDLELDQGADFGVQVIWTDFEQEPFTVLSPMRMEIRNDSGQIAYTLQTNDNPQDGDIETILYNSASGVIQLMIGADITATFRSGIYNYDLFVTYQDNELTNATRTHRLIAGSLIVNKRVTQNV